MQEAIKLWKECKVQSATFNFNCGGDSMNDTSWDIVAKKNKKKVGELESLLDDLVYKEVEFYEASDGHYQGEFGTVEVELDEDGDGDNAVLYFNKYSTSEYQESFSEEIRVEINETEKRLFTDYIENFQGGRDDTAVINYKMDCILTEEEERVIYGLIDRVNLIAEDVEITTDDYDPDINNGGDDWYRFEMSEIEENELVVSVEKSYLHQRVDD